MYVSEKSGSGSVLSIYYRLVNISIFIKTMVRFEIPNLYYVKPFYHNYELGRALFTKTKRGRARFRESPSSLKIYR